MTIAHPSYLPVLLCGFVLLLVYWRLELHRSEVRKRMGTDRLLAGLMVARSPLLDRLRVALLCVGWFFAALALMGLRGKPIAAEELASRVKEEKVLEVHEGKTSVQQRKAHAVIFLVDASESMELADVRAGGSRLEQAKEIVDEVISGLTGQSVAVYAFTSELTLMVPLTTDYLYTRLMTRELHIDEGDVAGTDLLKALDGIRDRYFGLTGLPKTLILLTDGGDTKLEGLSGDERNRDVQVILSRLGDPLAPQLQVFTVGLGTPGGAVIPGVTDEGKPVLSSLDEPLLRSIAERGRGKYYFGNAHSTLAIASDLLRQIAASDEFVGEEGGTGLVAKVEQTVEAGGEPVYEDYSRIPLALALLCFAVALALPEVRR